MKKEEIDRFFKVEKDKIVFIGDTCEIFIHHRFQKNWGVVEVGENLKTIGQFRVLINKKINFGMNICGVIEMHPCDVEKVTIDEVQYIKATFKKGNVFIGNRRIIRNVKLLYAIFIEYLSLGRMPEYMDYESANFFLDDAAEQVNVNFGTYHTISEMLMAHLYRDREKTTKFYRLTPMKNPPIFIPLRSVSRAPVSTEGKIIGSYEKEGLNAAMLDESDVLSPISERMRS